MSNNLRKNVSISYISLMIISVIGFISVPLLIDYMGTEIYGIWVLGFSLVSYLMLSNFGIPVSATALMAKTLSERVKKRIFFNSFVLLLLVSFLFGLLIYILDSIYGDWVKVLGNIKDEHLNIANSILMMMLIGFLIRLPFQLAFSAFSAYQKLFWSKAYETLIIVVNFCVLIVSIILKIDIQIFVFLTVFINLVINVMAFIHAKYSFFEIKTKENTVFSKKYMKIISNHSLSFFYIGIAATIVWTTDNIVIAHMFTMTDVAIYSVAFKLFTTAFLVFTTISGVMFPLYGKYYAERNWNKINEIYNLNLSILPAISVLIWIGGILFSHEIILIWTGEEELYGGLLLMVALGGYGFVLSIVNTHANLLSGLNLVKNTVKIGWLEAGVNLILSIILANYFGLAGIAMGTLLAAFLAPFIFFPYYIAKNTDNKVDLRVLYLFKISCLSLIFVFISVFVEQSIVDLSLKISIFFLLSISFIFIYCYFVPKTYCDKIKKVLKKRSLNEI